MTSTDYRTTRLDSALQSPDASLRLRAALAAGSDPMPADVPVLIAHCGTEPDFFVRDMLTWALTCHPADRTVPLLLTELGSPNPQACAQALHTLSKIGDARAWPGSAGAGGAAGDLGAPACRAVGSRRTRRAAQPEQGIRGVGCGRRGCAGGGCAAG